MADARRSLATTRVLRRDALRALEAASIARRPDLMEAAGAAVATLATTMGAERAGPVLVLAGPGNNGGDALVAARRLHERGIDVRVALLGDPAAYRGDAAQAWARWTASSGPAPVDATSVLPSAALVVDGLFGIGFKGAPTGRARDWIARVNATDCPVLAIDIPSGVDADTGAVADLAIEADRTLSFIAGKPGLYTGDALDHVGEVTIDTLGVERADFDLHLEPAQAGSLNQPALFPVIGRPRRVNSHKGSNGSVVVIGGDHGMVGAALMASRMALHAGAGRVYVRLIAADAPGYDVLQPELMLRSSLDGIDADAVAIGPGMGHGDAALSLLVHAIETAATLCIDADALNAIAGRDDLAALLRKRTVPAILTPHPLEAARLLKSDVKTVQQDRVAAAIDLARRFASVVVLKGAGTIVAEADGAWVINTTGNPALGTGGTGDVLSGLVGGLLAQRVPPVEAARAAVWVHGTAADDLVARGVGPIGLVATELIPAIRAVLNRALV
jgi:hydroxyethylthiazole kinase-like uncharacterized protein yjeF